VIRVAHFVHRIPPEYSGAGLQALSLIEELGKEEGVESSVIAYALDPARVDPPRTAHTTVVPIREGVLGKLRQYAALARAVRRTRADLVHVHGYHGPVLLFAWLLGKPVILKTTMLGVDDVPSIRARGRLPRLLVGGVARVVSLTAALHRANAGSARSVVVPNGVDLTVFRPRAAEPGLREGAGVPSDALLFLHAGGDSERKGFRRLPGLWNRLRRRLAHHSPHLVVSGRFRDPRNADRLRAEVEGDLTVIEGMLDLSAWLATGDVLLFLSRQEGLPNAVLEAVATDTFVLAQDIPDTYDGILDDSNSLVVGEMDDDAIEAVAARIEGGGHRSVDNSGFRERFALSRVAAEYRRLYAEVARGAP